MAGIPVDVAKKMQRENLSDMRKQYTKMRDIAQKRIERMGKSEFAKTKTYKDTAEGFPKLKDIPKEKFAKAFSELSKFVGAKRGSLQGQREIRRKTIASWNKQGIPLNKANYNRTIAILEEMRRRKIVYGSEDARELADLTLALSDDQFESVLDNLEKYLSNIENVADAMEELRDEETGYTKVDMNDLLTKIGW